tara:strand:- start:366 stop:617 length:252 start_codon:yes stop_codon:yes gene_type:complete
MEGVLNVESPCADWLCVGLSFLTLILGLMIGLRFRQVICKTLQPVIHKYNIHHLVPVKEIKENEVKKETVGPKEDNKEDKKED